MKDNELLQHLGNLIKKARMQRQISQIKFAEQIGMDAKTIRAMERGDRFVQSVARAKVERAFGWRTGAIQEIWDDREHLTPESITLEEMSRGFEEETFQDIENGGQQSPVMKASLLSDEELLAELSYRFRNYKVQLNGES